MTYDESKCEGWHAAIDAAAGLCWRAEGEVHGIHETPEQAAITTERWKALQGAAEAIEHLLCPYCSDAS